MPTTPLPQAIRQCIEWHRKAEDLYFHAINLMERLWELEDGEAAYWGMRTLKDLLKDISDYDRWCYAFELLYESRIIAHCSAGCAEYREDIENFIELYESAERC